MASSVSFKENSSSSFAILQRIARADKSAIQECIELYGNIVWALAKQFTTSTTDAEKAVLEIFMDVWQNAVFCDLEISDESVWIALLARRRLSNYAENNYQSPKSSMKMISTGNSDNIQKSKQTNHHGII